MGPVGVKGTPGGYVCKGRWQSEDWRGHELPVSVTEALRGWRVARSLEWGPGVCFPLLV